MLSSKNIFSFPKIVFPAIKKYFLQPRHGGEQNFPAALYMQRVCNHTLNPRPQTAVITRINIVVKLFPLVQPHFDQARVILVNDLRGAAWEGVGRRLSEDVALQAAAIRRKRGRLKFTGS